MPAREQTEHITNIIPVETKIFPMPTKGETMPPKEKLTAPSNAEAVPALVRSHSIANAVEVVKVIPIINSTASSNNSYTQKLQPKDNAAHSSTEKTSIPMQPINVPFPAGETSRKMLRHHR